MPADPFLACLSDGDFQQGLAAPHHLAMRSTRTMQLSKKSIGSCLLDTDEEARGSFPMARYALRAFRDDDGANVQRASSCLIRRNSSIGSNTDP